jgi:hypothetical protein
VASRWINESTAAKLAGLDPALISRAGASACYGALRKGDGNQWLLSLKRFERYHRILVSEEMLARAIAHKERT